MYRFIPIRKFRVIETNKAILKMIMKGSKMCLYTNFVVQCIPNQCFKK